MYQRQPRLLIVEKPLALQHPMVADELRRALSSEGNLIACREWETAPMDRIRLLYQEHQGKPFYSLLCELFEGQKTITHIYTPGERVNAESWIRHVREDLIGATIPGEAKSGSVRRYAYAHTGGKVDAVVKNGRIIDNAVHCSDSYESGIREGGIFYWDFILNPEKVVNSDEVNSNLSLGQQLSRDGNGIFFEERVEERLRRMEIVQNGKEFLAYEELPVDHAGRRVYGWTGSGETFTAAGKAVIENGERSFLAKACIKLAPCESVDEWMERRAVLQSLGITVPVIYHREADRHGNPGRGATYYEEYIPFSVEYALEQADPQTRATLKKQIGIITSVAPIRFASPRISYSDLRSDGRDIYFVDFGEDLGGLK